MAQISVAIILSAAGMPRQIRITVGDVVALLEPEQSTKLGLQLIELAAIARGQDAAATSLVSV